MLALLDLWHMCTLCTRRALMTCARGIHIPDELAHDIAREAEARGISWSAMTTTLLIEALKMRRVPGIVMVDGPTGRRAVVAGSGLDVWEIIATWQACGQDEAQTRPALSLVDTTPVAGGLSLLSAPLNLSQFVGSRSDQNT